MKTKHFILFIFIGISSFAQNMQEGFTYLETGKYKKAELFFKNILKEYPTNKTAKICYGRAIGLNGNATEATAFFKNILADFPADYEVKLNYAESLLWNKQYATAEKYYKSLVAENNQSFPALLGYANTLSNLKQYEKARVFVDKALTVMPNNNNALISKKYINLGLANSAIKKQNYNDAKNFLDKNLAIFSDDNETLLNLANLYLITNQLNEAEKVYTNIGKNPNNKSIALNGLSLVAHLKNKNKKALNISKQAINSLTSHINQSITNQTKERYIQALIWNKKYTAAKNEITTLLKEYPTENWVLALRATLNTYKSNFKKSLTDYTLILQKDSTSFDGNLGKANALKAMGYYNDAYKNAENTLSFYPNQKDVVNFIKNLDNNFTPFVDIKTSFSSDNGNNEAQSYKFFTEVPFSTKFKFLTNYDHRKTKNATNTIHATSNDFLIGLGYQLLPNLDIKGSFGTAFTKTSNTNYNEFLSNITLSLKPFKLQNLELGYKRELQNFNVDLLEKDIIQNHFFANYNLSTNFNLGWFTQYYYTSQTDSNTRNLVFTSIYYNFLEKPIIKSGLNYQNISFKNQVPTVYFSPKTFNAFEIFLNVVKDENTAKSKSLYYNLTAAFGYQFIEDNDKQGTYRIQGDFGYKFSDRTLLNIYGLQSNIASTTAAGFNFTEIGLRFKWYIAKNPLFRK
ncbi:tetratricopeptide repeat protein [Tenacibaculum sp. UWU-22]|uniref:tetratricopeptide repeat protein n=1 Tax=Tenacibaculum sp. UWU-22 TaxID=3234187 RepID=UPI0034DABBD0